MGVYHEDVARKAYINRMAASHNNFSCRLSGFVVDDKKPFLGASADGIAVNIQQRLASGWPNVLDVTVLQYMHVVYKVFKRCLASLRSRREWVPARRSRMRVQRAAQVARRMGRSPASYAGYCLA